MCSYYLKCCLKLYYVDNDGFNGIMKSPLAKLVKSEMSSSNMGLEDFLYNCIGFANDHYYTSHERFLTRSEISSNILNLDFFKEKSEELGFNRTSDLISHFKDLNVLGLGVPHTDPEFHKYSFKGFSYFLSNNAELVDLFCNGADYLCSPVYLNEQYLTYKQLSSLFTDKTFKGFINQCKAYNLAPFSLVKVIPSGSIIKMTDKGLYVPKSLIKESGFDLNYIRQALFYAYLIKANKINPVFYDYFEKYTNKFVDLFKTADEDFLYLIDLSNVFNISVKELLQLSNIKFVDLKSMLSDCRGVYQMSVLSINNKPFDIVKYLPEYCGKGVAVPACFELSRFVYLINNGVTIDYSEPIPKLGNEYLTMSNLVGVDI